MTGFSSCGRPCPGCTHFLDALDGETEHCARGILGSGVAELQTVGLRLGNLSLHSTLLEAGANPLGHR
jgi:hypothetical protein